MKCVPSRRQFSGNTQGGLVHIIKKNRLSNRLSAAIFKVVAAMQYGNVTPYSLVSIHHRPPYAK